MIENENYKTELFFHIIEKKQINIVFQPIISLRDGAVHGYEALCRGPQNTDMQSPGMLFEFAEKYNMIWDLEQLCRSKAFEAAFVINKDKEIDNIVSVMAKTASDALIDKLTELERNKKEMQYR